MGSPKQPKPQVDPRMAYQIDVLERGKGLADSMYMSPTTDYGLDLAQGGLNTQAQWLRSMSDDVGTRNNLARSFQNFSGDGLMAGNFYRNAMAGTYENPALQGLGATAAGDYLNNPYLEGILSKTAETMKPILSGVDAQFASSGRMGSGAYANARNTGEETIANTLNQLQFQNYNAERQRQQAAQGALANVAQAGAAGELGRAQAAIGLAPQYMAALNAPTTQLAATGQQMADLGRTREYYEDPYSALQRYAAFLGGGIAPPQPGMPSQGGSGLTQALGGAQLAYGLGDAFGLFGAGAAGAAGAAAPAMLAPAGGLASSLGVAPVAGGIGNAAMGAGAAGGAAGMGGLGAALGAAAPIAIPLAIGGAIAMGK